MMTFSYINFLFTLAVLFKYSHADNYVPVISWGNLDLKYPLAYAGHETTIKEFSLNYLEPLLGREKQTIFIFLQNKLGLHDFTMNADVFNENGDGGIYKNMKRVLDKYQNFVLPSVENPVEAISDFRKDFQGRQGKVYTLGSPYVIDNIVADGDNNLVIVPLPKLQGKNIQKIDTIIGQITDAMVKANAPFIALYTANQASKVPTLSMHSARNLLAVSDATNQTDISVISKCSLFYATSIQFGYLTGSSYTYTDIPNSYTSTSDCSVENSGIVTLTFNDLDGSLSAFSLRINSTLRPDGYWFMKTYANWTYNEESQQEEYFSGSAWAPRGFSYHCTRNSFNVRIKDEGPLTSVIRIVGLQIELGEFDTNEPEFSYANDCDGFFSIGSLLALFVGFILILIFAFGITMLSSINTMDRFDDPKGKCIVVNVND